MTKTKIKITTFKFPSKIANIPLNELNLAANSKHMANIGTHALYNSENT